MDLMNIDWITLIGFGGAMCTTASFMPQAIKTIRTKDTSGFSLSMYWLFTIGTLLWLSFGLLTGNIPVTVANAVTFIFAAIILFYKIKY